MARKSLTVIKNTNCLKSVLCNLNVLKSYHLNKIFSTKFSTFLPNKNIESIFLRKLSRYSANTIMGTEKTFSINDYDIIGFDLDNTLLRYNLPEMVKMEYDVMAEFLIKQKGYSGQHLLKPIESDLDFLQKGLLLDADRGNILQIGAKGFIMKAAHGTKMYSDSEIISIYGEKRNWDIASQFVNDPLTFWNGPLSEKIRALLDYFDMPASLLFARCIDSIDDTSKIPIKKYCVWSDLLAALVHIYTRENFDGTSSYFKAMKIQPERYVLKTSPKVINWLKKMKETKAIYLLTGSNVDLANLVATEALGENWRDLFDVVICFARKPGFFIGRNRKFMKIENFNEIGPTSEITLDQTYNQGNWEELENVLFKKFDNKQAHILPRSLYIGDNILQDIYTPSKHTNCDTIAVVEELLENESDEIEKHEFKNIISSNLWGSYFGVPKQPTIWMDIIRNHSKMCIPTVDYLAENNIEHKYKCFNGDLNGFYPGQPISFLKQ